VLLAYKIERIDIDDAEAEKLFFNAKLFHKALYTFLCTFAGDHTLKAAGSKAAMGWLKEIFPNCTEQFQVKNIKTRKSKTAPRM
jgi:hypothetical protein